MTDQIRAAPATVPNYEARYKFIRQYWLDGRCDMPNDAFHAKTPEAFDAAIDAVLKDGYYDKTNGEENDHTSLPRQ